MNRWLMGAAVLLVVGMLPAVVAAGRGRVRDRLSGLAMAGVVTTLEMLLLAEGYQRSSYVAATLLTALIRETSEEIGLHLRRDAIRMVTSVHYRNPQGHARVGFFFHAATWNGEPYNAEPHKCARIGWFPMDQLPANTVPYSRAGVELYRRGEPFGLQGWPHPAQTALAC